MDECQDTAGRRISVRELSQMLETRFSSSVPGKQQSDSRQSYQMVTDTAHASDARQAGLDLDPGTEIDEDEFTWQSDDSAENNTDDIYQNLDYLSETHTAHPSESDIPVKPTSEVPYNRNRISSAYDSKQFSDADERSSMPCSRAFSESQLHHRSDRHVSTRQSITSLPVSEDPVVSSPFTTSSIDSFCFDSDYEDEQIEDVFPNPTDMEQPLTTPCIPMRKDTSVDIKLHAIAKELLTTEEEYLESLHIIVKVLLINIKVVNKIEHMLPKEVVGRIFSNLQQIYEFHHNTLLPRLRECIYSWPLHQRLGGVLKSVAPFFKLYTDYTKTFKESIELVNSWAQKNHTFGLLVKEIENISDCKRRKITHLMLEPISRLPKYQALMKTYLQHLPLGAEDRRDTEDALLTITKTTLYSQELRKKDQNFFRLLELQRRLSGKINLLDSPRQLVYAGTVSLIDAKNTTQKERYMILLEDMLLLCAFSGMASVQLRLREELPIKELKVTDGNNPEFPFSFFLKSKAKTFHVNTRSPKELSTWLKVLHQTMTQYSNKAETFNVASNKPVTPTKENIGVGKNAPILSIMSAVSMCANCTCTFSAFRKKHHCKGCGKVMCAKCLPHKVSLEYDEMKPGKVCENCNHKIMNKSRDVEQDKGSGTAILTGFLQISGDYGKTWNRRWFVLESNKELYSFKAYQDVEPLTRMPVWRYHVTITTPEDEISQMHAFKMSNNLNEYIFQADNSDTVKIWITALQKFTEL